MALSKVALWLLSISKAQVMNPSFTKPLTSISLARGPWVSLAHRQSPASLPSSWGIITSPILFTTSEAHCSWHMGGLKPLFATRTEREQCEPHRLLEENVCQRSLVWTHQYQNDTTIICFQIQTGKVNFDPVKKNKNKLNWNTESFSLFQDSGFLINVQSDSKGCRGSGRWCLLLC